MVSKGISVNVKTKNTFKYDYLRGFLICLKNAQTIETLKQTKKQLRVRTKLFGDARILETLTSRQRS